MEHAVADVDVVDAEEVFLVLAMYCNHDKKEAKEALSFCFRLFVGPHATTMTAVRCPSLDVVCSRSWVTVSW